MPPCTGRGKTSVMSANEIASKLWDEATITPTDENLLDLIFVCGQESEEVRCHQSVICGASSNLASLLRGQEIQTRDGSWVSVSQVTTVFIPDVRAQDMRRVLVVLYNGFAQVSVDAAQELKRVWKDLGIDIVKLSNKEKIEVVQIDSVITANDRPYMEPGKISAVSNDHSTTTNNEHIQIKIEPKCTLEEALPKATENTPCLVKSNTTATKSTSLRGPASKRKNAVASPSPTPVLLSKKPKIEVNSEGSSLYFVEEVHTCCICHGKTKEGRVDKEGSNLSFTHLRKLKDHYSKHMYEEGLVQKLVPWGSTNTDPDTGNILDEFGSNTRYNCKVLHCWRFKKPAVGYKEFAIHNATDHGVLEGVLEKETRQELQKLLEKIRQVEEKEREETQPIPCVICKDKEIMHTNADDYVTLKRHYSTAHLRGWFDKVPLKGEGVRMQKVKDARKGTDCDLCQNKVFGDKERMIEHYAVIHKQLIRGLMDVDNSGLSVKNGRAIVEQLFSSEIDEFDKKIEN